MIINLKLKKIARHIGVYRIWLQLLRGIIKPHKKTEKREGVGGIGSLGLSDTT